MNLVKTKLQTLGAVMAISTMAAAGLGHIIADLAGMALAHYVEFVAAKIGVRQPFLTPTQVIQTNSIV